MNTEPCCVPDTTYMCQSLTRAGAKCRNRTVRAHGFCYNHLPVACRTAVRTAEQEHAVVDEEVRVVSNAFVRTTLSALPITYRYDHPCLQALGFGDFHHLVPLGTDRHALGFPPSQRPSAAAALRGPQWQHTVNQVLAGVPPALLAYPRDQLTTVAWSARARCGAQWNRVAERAELAALDRVMVLAEPWRRDAGCGRCYG